MKKPLFLLTVLLSILSSCQKMPVDIDEPQTEKSNISVRFSISQFEQEEFTSAKVSRSTNINELCTKVCLGVYQDGTRVKQLNLKSTDNDFVNPTISLSAGTYRFVILAHSDSKNPTMTNPEKITFGKGLTDTFFWSQDITIEKDTEIDVKMKRAVAMFRLQITDNIPQEVKNMEFYYTGGSSSINALTGKGCVNSKQTETLAIANDGTQTKTFEVYTFPRDDSNTLKMVISAYDANGNVVLKRTFEDIPIERNKVTQYKGNFFTDASTSKGTVFKLTSDDEWGSINKSF